MKRSAAAGTFSTSFFSSVTMVTLAVILGFSFSSELSTRMITV